MKNAGGRPTKYKPEYCKAIVEFFAKGGPVVFKPMIEDKQVIDHPLGNLPVLLQHFADHIGVCLDTLDEWKKIYPMFSEAYKKALKIQESQMLSGGLAGVYNPAVCIFALKNCHNWKDKHEIGGDVANPLRVVIEGDERAL